MPIFFDESRLTEEQRARYAWAVVEYARIQHENRQLAESGSEGYRMQHEISPQSALFARLLDGKQALPYPPPTSFSYPWYDIVETPGQYHVAIGIGPKSNEQCILLNQCPWEVLHKDTAASAFLAFLQKVACRESLSGADITAVHAALAMKPQFIVTYGKWGEFRLSLGRIIRRGRRAAVEKSGFSIDTFEGGNPVIVKVLLPGTELRAKSEATMADARQRLNQDDPGHPHLARITLETESAVRRAGSPEGDDLVEYDCDGWILERSLKP